MNCPFCNGEMEHGFLYTNPMYGFKWLPEGVKPKKYVPDFKFKKNGGMFFGSPKFEAFKYDELSFWVCKKCRKALQMSLRSGNVSATKIDRRKKGYIMGERAEGAEKSQKRHNGVAAKSVL